MTEMQKRLGLWTVVLLIFVPTFGFRNITNNSVALGAAAIPSWILVAVLFFLPLSAMIAELSSNNSAKGGGIYSWIESGLGDRWAFIGTWSYFVANLFYLQTVFSKIPVAISWMMFGENRFDDSTTHYLPFIAMFFILLLTWIATRGVNKFSKLSDWGGIFTIVATVVFIFFALLGYMLGKTPAASVINVETMAPAFDLAYFSTFSWLLFAVAGAEVAGTYAKEVDNPKRNFPRAVLIATAMIAGAYIIGSLAVSLIASPDVLTKAGLKDSGFVVYKILAENWGLDGKIVVQIYSAIFVVTAIAAYVLWMESPIRAMFSDVPDNTFPKFLTTKNSDGMLTNALWLQCALLLLLVAIPLLGIGTVEGFFRLLTDLSSLSLVIPYLILILAYVGFRVKKTQTSFTMFKSDAVAYTVSAVTFIVAMAGFVGAGMDYIDKSATLMDAMPMILKIYVGPLVLILAGMGLVALNRSLKSK